jgi:PAS domain S-box-containing protein
MREHLARAVTIGALGAALILFVFTAFETYNSTRALIEANAARSQVVASLEDLRLLLSALKDVETAQRGYLITGHDEFLEPLQSGIPTTRQKLRAVRAFGLAQAADLDRLERLVERKIEFLENSIRVRRVRGFDAAAAIVGTGEGRVRMELVRKEVAALEALYLNRLREREAASERQDSRATTVVFMSSVLAVLLVAASVVISARDSVRRARAERALAAEHAKLAATIASMPYGLVLFDRGGTIVLQNAAAKELLKLPVQGTSPETRRRIYRLLESDGREIPYEQWPTHQAVTGERIVGREVIVERPDATTVPLIINAAPLRNADGELLGAVAGFQDITHQFEVNRLKDEFVSTVSHELRTPLTSIKGSLQLVLAEPESVPDAEYRELLTIVLTNTERLIRLINDILDISKIEAGRLILKKPSSPPRSSFTSRSRRCRLRPASPSPRPWPTRYRTSTSIPTGSSRRS